MSPHDDERSQDEPAEVDPLPRTGWFERFNDLTIPDWAIQLGLVLSILAVYAQVVQFDFFNFDDDLHVYGNAGVRAGLTPASIKWAFTTVASSNWLPVTLLSHMVDVQLWGLHSGMHHLMNVFYHALAALLLYASLQRATGARAASAFVAFIFALHPLHVESVAWISERKDVLSTLFFFLALYAYVRYTEQPDIRRYLLVLGAFALGLMSKPMLVTFPFLLLLFDYWPLNRAKWPKILWEKLPMAALSAVASAVAYWVQSKTGALVAAIPLAGRIGKALLSYITYIRQTFWPAGLAVFYPYPRYILASRIGMALIILLGVSAFVVFSWRKRPYLATGWFWYLGTLVPVIGLVKVGEQSHADRYMYIPMVGLSIMVAWGAADMVGRWPQSKLAIGAMATVACVLCLALAFRQTGYWQDSETLYVRAIDATGDNWLAEGNLGSYLMKNPERGAEAMGHLETAIRLQPVNPEAETNLGLYLSSIGLCGAAIPHFISALHAKPNLYAAYNNLGMCLAQDGNYGAAMTAINDALRIKPDFADAHFNLAWTFSKLPGRDLEAVSQYQIGLREIVDPGSTAAGQAHRNLGRLFMNLGRPDEAISHFEAAQRIHPDPEISSLIDQLRAGRK